MPEYKITQIKTTTQIFTVKAETRILALKRVIDLDGSGLVLSVSTEETEYSYRDRMK